MLSLSTIIIVANIIGILVCIPIIILSWLQYRSNRNPLLIMSGIFGVSGLVMFSLILYLRIWGALPFPSEIPGLFIWSGFLFWCFMLLTVLVINRWLPDWWRGER